MNHISSSGVSTCDCGHIAGVHDYSADDMKRDGCAVCDCKKARSYVRTEIEKRIQESRSSVEHINPKLINFASILEDKTRAQAEASSSMPFIDPHMVIMPDAHLGKGATVGSGIPTNGAIMPAAVGVDIGCGMMAVRTQFTKEDFAQNNHSLSQLREAIEAAVPVSAGGYNRHIGNSARARIELLQNRAELSEFDPADYAHNWALQLGTLGSGNHFIEVSLDERDRVWLFLHSGSRGVGNKIASHHIKVAQKQCTKRFIPLPDPDLAYLVEGEEPFWIYIREMRWAQEFAWHNREEMMDRVVGCVSRYMSAVVERREIINCHHNYTTRERHFGKEVWMTRKGAIDATLGVRGLIPGSMGTASYVVTGLGNRVALNTAPHGAGRVYSRNVAKKTFTHDDLRFAMQGIEYRDTDAFLDEHPGAYKDIDVVMEDAKDLVHIDHKLRQILNVKGD